jgi:hypothetical protein
MQKEAVLLVFAYEGTFESIVGRFEGIVRLYEGARIFCFAPQNEHATSNDH